MDWAYLFEISLTGIASGGLYALAALAFVMVYKATRVVNIAIGVFQGQNVGRLVQLDSRGDAHGMLRRKVKNRRC